MRSLVVVREHLVAENSVCDLGCVHQSSSQEVWSEGGPARDWLARKHIKQECCGLLNHALRLEDVDSTLYVDKANVLLCNSRRKLSTLLGVGTDNVLQQTVEIGSVANRARVGKNLFEVTGLGHGGDHLLRGTGLLVDLLGQVGIVNADEITKLF